MKTVARQPRAPRLATQSTGVRSRRLGPMSVAALMSAAALTGVAAMMSVAAMSACSATTNSDPDASVRWADSAQDTDSGTEPDARRLSNKPRLSELLKNSPGPIDTHEFIEVSAAPGTNLGDYRLLVLEGDRGGSSNVGSVDTIFMLGITNPEGLYFTNFLQDTLENGSLTVLLVRALYPSVVIGTDLDPNDDGTLDFQLWDELVDSIALVDDAGDAAYAPVVLSNNFDGAMAEVVGASRLPDSTSQGSPDHWVRANNKGIGLEGIAGTGGLLCERCGTSPGRPGEALITPGAINALLSAP